PFADGAFDLVVSYLSLVDIPGLDRAISEMARVLRPGGALLVANLASHNTAGHWLRDASGSLTRSIRHICWDGCMFPNDVMMKPQTWNDILAVMVNVREQHGWSE
ncbi:MAG TPA: methyltransferase domain-containing protein, partial [Tepidisphaeraceae bacterium]|nr:methyltransferase domain-containing protein [Tepidisphaeraceae bacterium]